MEEVNKIRKAALKKVYIATFLVFVIGYLTFKFSTVWWHYAIGVFLVLICIGFGMDAVDSYKSEFINNIIKPVLRANDMQYFPKDGFKEEDATASNLFDFDYDDYESKSLIIGNNFKLAYVKFTKEEEVTDKDGNVDTYTKTEFSGFLVIAKHSRFVNSNVLLKPSGFHLSDIVPITYDKRRVKMDNPEFENIFDVYCDDQVEARYLLDHSYMELLIKLYKDMGVEYLSFIKDTVYSKLEYDDFEDNIPLDKEIDDKIVQKVLFPLLYAIYMQENLNRDIYKKQKVI